MDDATIAAIATPQGRGGIGIVKISGNSALPIATAIFRKKEARKFLPGPLTICITVIFLPMTAGSWMKCFLPL
ncbi:MAG: hypothetical protein HC887_03370 [Desulfobacteraceae bacterium]|nr:hypothetical protein [Desulfobacteraceae bacterium]